MAERWLDEVAQANGIMLSYTNECGDEVLVSDAAKRGLLRVLGVNIDQPPVGQKAPDDSGTRRPQHFAGRRERAFMPGWLKHGRAWGVTCQLYAIASRRNLGIGDFEDLAQLAELAAVAGADFIGVNPLHALFLAAPHRISPYSPSSRRFINPLYIALDTLDEGTDAAPAALRDAQPGPLVDYERIASVKVGGLRNAFAVFCCRHLGSGSAQEQAYERFCEEQSTALDDFAIFEALSHYQVRDGGAAGWKAWPDALKVKTSDAVRNFVLANEDEIAFHRWLQWVCDRQLAEAQRRALDAGMRIGIYLDLAVGTAPDGADTWSDPRRTLAGARIGAPPDAFNPSGQDWGLAPLSPSSSEAGRIDIFEAVIAAAMRHAGAIRLDHVMALQRLYLIPEDCTTQDGAYLIYPREALLDTIAECSTQAEAIVIGEDLGTVPDGFRGRLRRRRILGYRLMFFERSAEGFLPPAAYDRNAMACVGTHDLPPLAGWWEARDVDERHASGLLSLEQTAAWRCRRQTEVTTLITALATEGLLTPEPRAESIDGHDRRQYSRLPVDVATAVHRFIARTPCRLVAVQLEDLVGARDSVNLPGTADEHPNWQRRLPTALDELARSPLFLAITEAMRAERPRRT